MTCPGCGNELRPTRLWLPSTTTDGVADNAEYAAIRCAACPMAFVEAEAAGTLATENAGLLSENKALRERLAEIAGHLTELRNKLQRGTYPVMTYERRFTPPPDVEPNWD